MRFFYSHIELTLYYLRSIVLMFSVVIMKLWIRQLYIWANIWWNTLGWRLSSGFLSRGPFLNNTLSRASLFVTSFDRSCPWFAEYSFRIYFCSELPTVWTLRRHFEAPLFSSVMRFGNLQVWKGDRTYVTGWCLQTRSLQWRSSVGRSKGR